MTEWVLVPVEPTQAMIDATNSVPEGAGYLSCVRAYRAMLDAAPAWQAEPVAWVRNLTDPQPHCVTGLQYRTAADADAGVQYIPVYLHPPAAEVQRLARDFHRLQVAATAVTTALYDRERLFAVAELRAALAALEGGA